MKELSFSPVSSPGSEFETEARIDSEKQEEELSPAAARDVAQISKQPETDLVVEGEKEPITSPETFLDVSSDEERAEETIDHPLAAAKSEVIDSELAEGQEEDADIERKQGDTKVEVLDSASMPYSDDHVQDMGTVEEVLEVLEQKLSSDEESDESEEEEEEEEEEEGEELRREEEKEEEQREDKFVEEVEPEGMGVGVASEIGDDVVSGEGVMVGGEEDEDDMVETLSAMVHTEPQPQPQPQQQQTTCTVTTVTTESVRYTLYTHVQGFF